MELAAQIEGVSVNDYLAGEEVSEVKHEYIGGMLYAMAGATKDHNQIAGSIYAFFHSRLRGTPCRAFIADVKVRLNIMGDDVFYYPDVMVGCDSRDTHKHFLCFPKVIVEVSSKSTERLDRREKRWSYQTIETIEEYIIVTQDRIEVTLFRRSNNWLPEVYVRRTQNLEIKSLGLTLPLSAVYEGILQTRKA